MVLRQSKHRSVLPLVYPAVTAQSALSPVCDTTSQLSAHGVRRQESEGQVLSASFPDPL